LLPPISSKPARIDDGDCSRDRDTTRQAFARRWCDAASQPKPDEVLESLRDQAQALLDRHWGAIDIIAAALLVRKRLTGEEIGALLWSSQLPAQAASINVASPSGQCCR
jgi:hypothetical protein